MPQSGMHHKHTKNDGVSGRELTRQPTSAIAIHQFAGIVGVIPFDAIVVYIGFSVTVPNLLK